MSTTSLPPASTNSPREVRIRINMVVKAKKNTGEAKPFWKAPGQSQITPKSTRMSAGAAL